MCEQHNPSECVRCNRMTLLCCAYDACFWYCGVKVSFHYPSWRVSKKCTRVHGPSTRAVNSGSGNRPLGHCCLVLTLYVSLSTLRLSFPSLTLPVSWRYFTVFLSCSLRWWCKIMLVSDGAGSLWVVRLGGWSEATTLTHGTERVAFMLMRWVLYREGRRAWNFFKLTHCYPHNGPS